MTLPSRMPGAAEGARPRAVDVAVVGAGPVGVTLALLLARLGVSCAVLESRTAPHGLPRAVHLDDEALMTLEAAGVARDFTVRRLDGMTLLDRALRPLVEIERTRQPLGRPQSVLMHQPDLEAALWRRAAGLLRPGRRVTRIVSRPEAVDLHCETGEALTARWAVGCDGASSALRGLVGIGVADLGFHQRWLVVDLLVPGGGHHPPRVLQVCDPARPATSVPVGGGRHRFEFRAADAESDTDLIARAGLLAEPLARRLGLAGGEVERATVYEFRGRAARTLRRGRVLLAGDAAHEMPPFLGQGLCTGLRDATNLAWKLAFVVRGRACSSLLDTYAAERLPHARRAIALTAAVGRVITEQRPWRAGLRNRLLRVGERALPLGRLGRMPVPPLPRGTLVEDGGHPWGWGLERRLEIAPDAFAIVGVGMAPDAGLPAELRRWLEDIGAVFATLPADACPPGVLVVRPDRFVLGRYRPPGPGEVSPLAGVAARLSRAGLRAPP